jgi:hypothetical protein
MRTVRTGCRRNQRLHASCSSGALLRVM